MMNNNNSNNNSVVFVVVNRDSKALFVNGSSNKYSKLFNHNNSQKASMLVISKLLEKTADNINKYDSITIIVPKNLYFILRKESVYEWINNNNKTNKGTILDPEFITLAKYISDMRNYLDDKVSITFKMIGNSNITSYEHNLIKQAWNQLDKLTNHKYNNKNTNNNKPIMPKSIANRLN